MRSSCTTAVVALLLLALIGCSPKQRDPSANPSFPISTKEARATLRKIESRPKPLERPLVVLNGFLDPGFGGAAVAGMVRQHVKDTRIITVAYPFASSFEDCRKTVIEAVDRAFPSDDQAQTREVDVIGLSMGGLVGRYCAAPANGHRRLNVRRLFTVSSPHQGALRAQRLPPLLKMQMDMRPNSMFLQHLQESEACVSYEIIPYVRLNDRVIGPANAAPAGRWPWWVPNEPMQNPHIGAATDARILADILRRLRSEKPLSIEPAAPVPTNDVLANG